MKEGLQVNDIENGIKLDAIASGGKLKGAMLDIMVKRPDLISGSDFDKFKKMEDFITDQAWGSEEKTYDTKDLISLQDTITDLRDKLMSAREEGLITGIQQDYLEKIDSYIDLPGKISSSLRKSIEKNKESTSNPEVILSQASAEVLYGKKTPENMISLSDSLRSLLKNLDEIGDITGPDGYVYKKDYLIPLIGNLKGSDDENLNKVTRAFGLRDKVKYILLRQELDKKFNK